VPPEAENWLRFCGDVLRIYFGAKNDVPQTPSFDGKTSLLLHRILLGGVRWATSCPFSVFRHCRPERIEVGTATECREPTDWGRLDKGTGKSLAVSVLAAVLPEIETVDGCPFNYNPVDPTNMCKSCLKLCFVKKLLEVGASDFTSLAAAMMKALQVLRLEN
jgi:hypothetical protein